MNNHPIPPGYDGRSNADIDEDGRTVPGRVDSSNKAYAKVDIRKLGSALLYQTTVPWERALICKWWRGVGESVDM